MIASDRPAREKRRITALAREYGERGYEVFRGPYGPLLPERLQRFVPDLIALTQQEGEPNLVIEVRSSRTLHDRQIVELAAQLAEIDGWELVLVVTNPRMQSAWLVPEDAGPASWEQLERQRKTALELLGRGESPAALLTAWAVLEGSLRNVAWSQFRKPAYPRGTAELLNQMATEGFLEAGEYHKLRDLILLRNRVAHGFDVEELPSDATSRLLELSSAVRQRAELDDDTHAQAQ